MTYAEKLKNPRWQKRRLYVMERDEWKCRVCGETKETLNVHHLQYGKEPWDVPDDWLLTVCHRCHKYIETLQKNYIRFSPDDFLVFWIDQYIMIFVYRDMQHDGLCAVLIGDGYYNDLFRIPNGEELKKFRDFASKIIDSKFPLAF